MAHTASVKQLVPLCLFGTRHRLLRCKPIHPASGTSHKRHSGCPPSRWQIPSFAPPAGGEDSHTIAQMDRPRCTVPGGATCSSRHSFSLCCVSYKQNTIESVQGSAMGWPAGRCPGWACSHPQQRERIMQDTSRSKVTPSAASLSTCVELQCTHELLHKIFS